MYSFIRLNQHCPLQNNIPLMQHGWPSEIFTPHSKIGSRLLLASSWRQLQPSERRQVFENNNPLPSILILGTIKSQNMSSLENEEPAGLRECTFCQKFTS
jgi:hypothetical protein